MALYAIGDLHLSLGAEKPMDVFGGRWQDYMEKLDRGLSVLRDGDVIVLCGDTSWGMTLEQALPDLAYLDRLPGTKILVKGNHDYWWTTAAKMNAFFEGHGLNSLHILHNNCWFYGGIGLCGSRGWFYEEGVHGGEHDRKIMNREIQRLETSLRAAEAAERKLVFLHYPPRFRRFVCHDIIRLMAEHGVTDCYYGHIHGAGHALAFTGQESGVRYHMISSDHVGFTPVMIEAGPGAEPCGEL